MIARSRGLASVTGKAHSASDDSATLARAVSRGLCVESREAAIRKQSIGRLAWAMTGEGGA